MKQESVTMVRVYLTEGDHQMQRLMHFLHAEEKVRGITAFRGIAGIGASGRMHTSSLIDVSLDLPLVVEFFDRTDKVEGILEDLNKIVEPGHVVSWPASLNMGE
ncbi:DUF190 domain-containing protein [Candidatus Endoriftia persephonae]|jgi:PII-like signaling protein|nr:DUF190 domain-containing protein [Candidatus Endoriftia persephone]EGV52421.1 hypothetical protein Rifp1Sym_ai00180 [endosymbiont of Riftia pachyptila (vent Ph05)]KRT56101.1 PII-like signaling protein [endosymbiont of Ridgeia piscesae]KRT59934.1 hypothetical protein Ga0076813_16368 [endosymbiont of Ridgeia piscesae]USF89183.1 DUF190 domain-containing protein [Candidatus Endoriftia persephone]